MTSLEVSDANDSPVDLGSFSEIKDRPGRINLLAWLSAVYLLAPVVLFALFWLRPAFSLLVLVAVGAAFWALGKPRNDRRLLAPFMLIAIVVAALWVWTTGILGGVFHPALDWYKHFAVLSDLTQKPWPVHYTLPNGSHDVLRYYLGFYLVPAFFGKIVGFGAVPWLVALWLGIGLVLVLAQILRLFSTTLAQVGAAVAFVLFSGMDIIGWRGLYVFHFHVPIGAWTFRWPHLVHLSAWSSPLEFTSNTALVHWVPDQTLAGWLGLLLLIEVVRNRKLSALPVAVFATLLWSPLACIGIVVFGVVALVVLLVRRTPWLSRQVIVPWVLMGAGSAVLAMYLTAGSSGLRKGFVGNFIPFPYFPDVWLSLELLWVVVYILLIFGIGLKPGWLTTTALFSLLLMPLFWFGFADEFDRRATIPALLVLCLVVLRALFAAPPLPPGTSRRRIAGRHVSTVVLCLALAIGALTPISEFTLRAQLRVTPPVTFSHACSMITPSCHAILKGQDSQFLVPASNHSVELLLR